MAADPAVSVVLATYRRPAALGRLLDGLAGQRDAPPFEVVVVDNDADGPAARVVAADRAWPHLPPRYAVETARGASHARNRAVAEAVAPVLALTDDDVVPQPSWLARLTAPILAGRADVTGGPVRLDPSVPRPRWFDEPGIGGYLTAFDLGPAERDLRDREFLVTANLALRRSDLEAVGGFDPRMGPRGGSHLVSDDTRLVWALRASGTRVRYVPGALVTHELPAERLSRRYLIRRAYSQGRSDWLVEREELSARRFRGARVPLSWLGGELRRRRAEGLGTPAARFHTVCDLARTAGALGQCLRG